MRIKSIKPARLVSALAVGLGAATLAACDDRSAPTTSPDTGRSTDGTGTGATGTTGTGTTGSGTGTGTTGTGTGAGTGTGTGTGTGSDTTGTGTVEDDPYGDGQTQP